MRTNPLAALGRRLGRSPTVMRGAPVIAWLEQWLRRLTHGRAGLLDVAGLPSLELTVTGRRTGLPRTVSLLYVPDGPDTYLLVGSNWGRAEHPSWSTNLNAVNEAEINCGGKRFAVQVRRLGGAERDTAWQRAVTVWPGYRMEQHRAGAQQFRLYRLTRISQQSS